VVIAVDTIEHPTIPLQHLDQLTAVLFHIGSPAKVFSKFLLAGQARPTVCKYIHNYMIWQAR
jgi:hypothetical protein